MPLILCPACESKPPMQAVQRHGVEFDVCTACRGVWLDRGELEKLLEATRQDREAERQDRETFDRDRAAFYRDPDDFRRRRPQPPPRHAYGERGEQGHYDGRSDGRRRRGFDLFDIFD